MPPSAKAPPKQQSNLSEMWGKKAKANQVQNAEEPVPSTEPIHPPEANSPPPDNTKSSPSFTTPPEVKRASSDTADSPAAATESLSQPKRKRAPAQVSKSTKKRRVVDSDDEMGAVEPAPLQDTALPTSSPPPDDGMLSEPSEDEAVEEDEELETGNVATSKIAEAALSRVKEVDLKGGWKRGSPVPYAALATAFSLIESTTKRLEKTAILTAFLLLVIQRSGEGDRDSLLQTVYLCINRLCPDYIGMELGLGESLLIKAIGQSTGRPLATVKAELKKEGDLGLVALNSKNTQRTLFKPKALTLPFVFSSLKDIASTTGHSSQAKKVSVITKLLSACEDLEAKYLIRSLEGKLRIGNAERSVLVSLAHAAVLSEHERNSNKWSSDRLVKKLDLASNTLKSVYSELPSYDLVIPALLAHGVGNLKTHCKLTPSVPLKPMLAKPTKAIGEVLDRFEGKRFTCEYKYDGERAQVHRHEAAVSIFSRNSEDMSKKYPDLVLQLPRCIKESTESFVLDAEAVAIDRTTGKLLPFQELSRRKRKDVRAEDVQVKVCLFAFDLLYLNGEPLLQKSLRERRDLLTSHFTPVDGEFQFAKSSDGETMDEIQVFLEDSVKDGCEGLMVKMLESEDSWYEPSRRSINWLKLKKDYLAGVGDSLDLVVIGAFYGKGKRTSVYGAFLLAIYDSSNEEYQSICKIGTGFSEEELQSHYAELHPFETTKPRGDVKIGGAKADVWFEPKVVWEVLAADLSLSPIYTAAQGLVDERGISLRFPRFVRIRDDKGTDDATGPEQVAEMYEKQALAQQGKSKGKSGEDDFW